MRCVGLHSFSRRAAALLSKLNMNVIKQLISDGEMPSTMRVLVLLIVAPIMIVWAALCIKRGEFIAIPMEQASLIGAALAAKWGQVRIENPSATPAPVVTVTATQETQAP